MSSFIILLLFFNYSLFFYYSFKILFVISSFSLCIYQTGNNITAFSLLDLFHRQSFIFIHRFSPTGFFSPNNNENIALSLAPQLGLCLLLCFISQLPCLSLFSYVSLSLTLAILSAALRPSQITSSLRDYDECVNYVK